MTPATVTRLAGFTAAAIVAVVVTVLPAPALAAGTTTLALDGPAAGSLRAQGVTIAAQSPAKGGARRIVLPISAGLAGSTTTLLRQRGAISLSAGARKVRLAKLSLIVGKSSRMEAKVDGESVELFKVLPGGRRVVDPATGKVDFANLKLKLTGAGARAIAKHLGLAKLAPKRFGTLAAAVSGLTPAGAPSGGGGGQQTAGCPLPSGAGPAPEDPLPPAPSAPSGAATITSASIDWHVRESFIRYVGSGEGTSVSGGATADPPVLLPGASAALSYGFHFPFASGWLDDGANPADPADDTARVGFGGAVRFQFSAHGIDLRTANPEIELAGANSRAIFTITDGAEPAERQVLINLDLSRAAAIKAAGNTYTYERVPGAIPAGTASSTFAGFYAPGTDFGCVTVSFSAAP